MQENGYGTDPADPSSRPGVVINEVYYDHPGSDDGEEFVALFNPEEYAVDISGFRIESGTTFNRQVTVPEETEIPAGCFFLIGEENVVDINSYDPDIVVTTDSLKLELQNGD